jgi:hypothetical protein
MVGNWKRYGFPDAKWWAEFRSIADFMLNRCTGRIERLASSWRNAKGNTTMPRAVLKNGVICPLEPLPPEWHDGRELRVESVAEEDENQDIDAWHRELEALVALNDPNDCARVAVRIQRVPILDSPKIRGDTAATIKEAETARSNVMTSGSNFTIQQDAHNQFELQLVDGNKVICQSQGDAELVLDAGRRFYEGIAGRKLPRQTLAALERAGLNAANSMLYRFAMHNLSEE